MYTKIHPINVSLCPRITMGSFSEECSKWKYSSELYLQKYVNDEQRMYSLLHTDTKHTQTHKYMHNKQHWTNTRVLLAYFARTWNYNFVKLYLTNTKETGKASKIRKATAIDMKCQMMAKPENKKISGKCKKKRWKGKQTEDKDMLNSSREISWMWSKIVLMAPEVVNGEVWGHNEVPHV